MYDIESYVTRNFEEYKYSGSPPADICVCCPFCIMRGAGQDTKFHLYIHLDPSKQVVHCFRCGYASNWIHFVMDVSYVTYWQAIGELYVTPRIRDDIKDVIMHNDSTPDSIQDIKRQYALPDDFQLLRYKSDSNLVLMAREYLLKRGFSRSTWVKYNLGVAESLGFRVVIPIEDGYWQARSIIEFVQPKYVNPKHPVRHVIFNSKALRMYDEVVICEGAFSAMSIGDNAIALLGKDAPKEKITRLLESDVNRFIIALEEGAFPSVKKLADALSRNKSVVIWKYIGGDPADNCPYIEMEYNMKTAVKLMLDMKD